MKRFDIELRMPSGAVRNYTSRTRHHFFLAVTYYSGRPYHIEHYCIFSFVRTVSCNILRWKRGYIVKVCSILYGTGTKKVYWEVYGTGGGPGRAQVGTSRPTCRPAALPTRPLHFPLNGTTAPAGVVDPDYAIYPDPTNV